MIDREHQLSVSQQAKLLDVSRAAVYYQARPICERDLALMRLIDEIHLEQPHWGARGILRMLRPHEGAKRWLDAHPLGRKHVATLMRRMGIEAPEQTCDQPVAAEARHEQEIAGARTQRLSVSVAQYELHRGQSSLGDGHHLHSHASRFCLADRIDRCGHAPRARPQALHDA
jgi:hypothetical protein